MANIKVLIALAFSAAVGVSLLILACSAKSSWNWWPMFIITFYVLTPIPWLIVKRQSDDFSGGTTTAREVAVFFITVLVVSAFALPGILAHPPVALNGTNHTLQSVIEWGQAGFVWAANVVVFFSILLMFISLGRDDGFAAPF